MELLRIQHEHFFKSGLRIDGRKFNEFRDFLINIDSIETADASSIVKLGSTTVMCCMKVTVNDDIKALQTVNYSDLIDLKVSLHTLEEDNGDRDTITCLLVKLIKNNVLFDHKPLICEDEDGERQYLTLNIELTCLNGDGNIFDAFILALLGALASLEFPDYKDICAGNNYFDSSSRTVGKSLKRLTLLKFPISITSALMSNGDILVDPNGDEEQLATSLMSIVFDVVTEQIIILEKKGGTPMDDVSLLKYLSFASSIASKFYRTTPLFHHHQLSTGEKRAKQNQAKEMFTNKVADETERSKKARAKV